MVQGVPDPEKLFSKRVEERNVVYTERGPHRGDEGSVELCLVRTCKRLSTSYDKDLLKGDKRTSSRGRRRFEHSKTNTR